MKTRNQSARAGGFVGVAPYMLRPSLHGMVIKVAPTQSHILTCAYRFELLVID